MKDNSPKYLDVKEMCEVLRIGRRRLMALIDDGDIVAYRVGKHANSPLRFDAGEPERYLRSQRMEPVSAA